MQNEDQSGAREGDHTHTVVAAPPTAADVVGSASSAGGSPSVLGNAPATDSSGAATSVRPDYWVIAVAGFNHPIGIHITTEQLAADAATVRQRMKALGDPYPALSVNGNDLVIAAAAKLLPTQDAYAIGQQGNWALRAMLYAGGPTSQLPLPTARLVGADVAAHFDALDCSVPGEAVNQIADAANNQTAVTQIECGGSDETSKYLLGSVLLTGGAPLHDEGETNGSTERADSAARSGDTPVPAAAIPMGIAISLRRDGPRPTLAHWVSHGHHART